MGAKLEIRKGKDPAHRFKRPHPGLSGEITSEKRPISSTCVLPKSHSLPKQRAKISYIQSWYKAQTYQHPLNPAESESRENKESFLWFEKKKH